MLVLKDSQKVLLKAKPKSAAGNPAPVHGAPVWTSSDEAIITLEPATDGMTCWAVTTGTIGTSQVRAEADADMGAGVTPITNLETIEVRGGDAVQLGIEAGEPEEKDAVPTTAAPAARKAKP